MPYLPLDLDAKRKAHDIERGLGLQRGVIVSGLMDVWEIVWRDKKDIVDDLTLDACFGSDPRVRAALVARDFIEPAQAGHRVRGAAKWLFGLEGKSRGGKAASANLKRGTEPGPAAATFTAFPASAGDQPEPTSGREAGSYTQHPASSTQHPTTLPTEETPPAPPSDAEVKRSRKSGKAKREPNPRHGPLLQRLKAIFQEIRGYAYDDDGADSAAVTRLCAKCKSNEEVERRWHRALTTRGHPGTSSLVQFAARWNELGGQASLHVVDVTRGVARANDADWNEEQVRRFEAGGRP